jgi:phage tail sheath protein FI
MPEYLAPGVYVEETSFRAKSIEGVSTTTTGFIGASRYGPIELQPDIITSLGEFERTYGDRGRLQFAGQVLDNYLWHAVRAFFEEGGKRLYVSRVFRPLGSITADDADKSYHPLPDKEDAARRVKDGLLYRDGHARSWLPGGGNAPNDGADTILVRARFPGAAGNLRIRFTLRLGQNILGADDRNNPTLGGINERDVVWVRDVTLTSPPTETGAFYRAESAFDTNEQKLLWTFRGLRLSPLPDDIGHASVKLAALAPNPNEARSDKVRVLTMTVTVLYPDGSTATWDGLSLDPEHVREGSPDSLFARFARTPSNSGLGRTLPIVITHGDGLADGLTVLAALFRAKPALSKALEKEASTDAERSIDIELNGGNDGQRPRANEYEGVADDKTLVKMGLKQFEDIEDISIVAAPGSTFGYENGYRPDAASIVNLLLSHAARMRYRIAVLDAGNEQSISAVRAMRAKIDSTYGALYYPWVRVLDPVTGREIHLPPSGFVAGIYARNDVNRAVYKAPANEVVNLAIGFEQLLNKAQQDVLNPEGINCFRFFEGRGFRLWGARTVSSDPEWKYVNLRRYFAYLERSIDRGTQWVVFEPNGEALWANVRRTVEDFLLNEWQSGALLGDKPEKAYFVKCDRSTMTQNDLDNGRLICLVGVAPLRPAEFVIFRIGQWTADRKA